MFYERVHTFQRFSDLVLLRSTKTFGHFYTSTMRNMILRMVHSTYHSYQFFLEITRIIVDRLRKRIEKSNYRRGPTSDYLDSFPD